MMSDYIKTLEKCIIRLSKELEVNAKRVAELEKALPLVKKDLAKALKESIWINKKPIRHMKQIDISYILLARGCEERA